mmetsp:Transcript_25877/g.73628  ORF Transcript_25877/g.73628 Transcript_25877/m.73628 type:complete len:218 (-) Transcript_25877:52-705(-)
MVADVASVHQHAERLRAILDHADAAPLAELGHDGDVGDAAADVREEQKARAEGVRLVRQVRDVDPQVRSALYRDESASGPPDGRSRGGAEGVAQHTGATSDAGCLQRQKQRGAVGVQSDAVLEPRELRDLALHEGHRGGAVEGVAPEQLAALQQLGDLSLRLMGHGLRCRGPGLGREPRAAAEAGLDAREARLQLRLRGGRWPGIFCGFLLRKRLHH